MGESKRKHGWLTSLLAMVLALAVSLPLSFLPHGRVEAAGSQMANLVIFVKHKSDDRDVFNAVYTSGGVSYSNWQRIRQMYEEGTGTGYNNSFASYVSVITEGRVGVANYFPQENADKKGVKPLILSSDNNDGGSSLVDEVIRAINDGRIILDAKGNKLDNQNTGFIDNLTIIVQGDTAANGSTAYHATYAGTEKINGSNLRVSHYNVIPSTRLMSDDASLHVTGEKGVIAHEFLHTLGLPDLYRTSGSGEPVGIWDVMASPSYFLQYPLSYLRARQGWIPMETITQSGTYTLTAVSESGGSKVFALRTPLSDSEFICLEYRKKSGDISRFEYRIPASGLLMYRVDNKVDGLDNRAGKNYIYVYRPGVTDPEAAADTASNGSNLVNSAVLDGTAGKTSYGSTDLSADYTKNTLYYSDGTNSGIQISDVKLNGNQLTFTVAFADYKNEISWEGMGDTVSSQCAGDPFLYTDPATGTVYAAFTESIPGNYSYGQVSVKRWDGSAWQQAGAKISPAAAARPVSLAVCGGDLYLSYLDQTGHPVYCRLENGSWKQIARHDVSHPKYMQFAADGADLYAAYEHSGRWMIYNLKSNSLVDSQLTAADFGNPSMLALDGSIYIVYAAYPNGKTEIKKYSNGVWNSVDTVSGRYTNSHYIARQGSKIYAFASIGTVGQEGTGGQNAFLAVFDKGAWTNHTIAAMEQFNFAAMALAGDQVCLAYQDTSANRVKLLQGTGSSFRTIADNLGTSVEYLGICSYGSNVYIATVAQNTDNLVVRRVTVEGSVPPGGDGEGTDKPVNPPAAQEERLLTLTPPEGYTDNCIYIDGVEHAAVKNGGSYQLKLQDTSGKTAVMYAYDARNIPVGMYVWRLTWEGQVCRAVAMPGLQNLLSYHGFSIRVQSPAGIRFKSGIDAGVKQRLIAGNVDGCRLKEYGTLFITNENRKKYPFVKDGTKVGGGRAYWTENGKVTDKVFETVGGRNRFTSVLINLAPNMYAKDISFRAYAVLEWGGQDLIIYGPPVYRSVYTVAKQVQAKGEFKPGSSGYRYVQGIIDSVEKGSP